MSATTRTGRNRVAVVTGGTQGIGRATAQLFARRGWSVAVIARGEQALRATEAELLTLGARALAIRADVSDAAAMDAAAARIERELGPIGAWVNNAMATVVSPAERIAPEEFRRVTDVTYHGQVFGTLAALRHMKPRGGGAIVQVSSGLGFRSAPLQSAYCAAKAAVGGFTDSLRTELLHEGSPVTLSVVYLPAVNTPQFDRTRNHTGRAQTAPDPVYDPRLCAEAILSAVESPQREVWVGTSVLQMAAAQALAPSLGDRAAASMWDAQLADRPPAKPEGNLFEPLPGDPGVDGRFRDRVVRAPGAFWTSRGRNLLTAGLGTLAAVGAVALVAAGSALARDRLPGR